MYTRVESNVFFFVIFSPPPRGILAKTFKKCRFKPLRPISATTPNCAFFNLFFSIVRSRFNYVIHHSMLPKISWNCKCIFGYATAVCLLFLCMFVVILANFFFSSILFWQHFCEEKINQINGFILIILYCYVITICCSEMEKTF